MTSWELDYWPTAVKWYLEDAGYLLAEEFMGRSSGPPAARADAQARKSRTAPP